MSEICPKAVKLIRADVFRFTLEADYRARDSRRNFHAAKHLGSRELGTEARTTVFALAKRLHQGMSRSEWISSEVVY